MQLDAEKEEIKRRYGYFLGFAPRDPKLTLQIKKRERGRRLEAAHNR